jgi:putative SOS response-associated peptidase YedK
MRCAPMWRPASKPSQPKVPHWFAPDDDRPLFAFAGIWRPWTGARGTKAAPIEGEHLLFSFLTTDANDVVRSIHAKAMLVILTEPREFEAWLAAPVGDALRLQRPSPNDRLKIVATGLKADNVIEPAVLA